MHFGAAASGSPSAGASRVCWAATSRSRASLAAGRRSRFGYRWRVNWNVENAEECVHPEGSDARERRLAAEVAIVLFDGREPPPLLGSLSDQGQTRMSADCADQRR